MVLAGRFFTLGSKAKNPYNVVTRMATFATLANGLHIALLYRARQEQTTTNALGAPVAGYSLNPYVSMPRYFDQQMRYFSKATKSVRQHAASSHATTQETSGFVYKYGKHTNSTQSPEPHLNTVEFGSATGLQYAIEHAQLHTESVQVPNAFGGESGSGPGADVSAERSLKLSRVQRKQLHLWFGLCVESGKTSNDILQASHESMLPHFKSKAFSHHTSLKKASKALSFMRESGIFNQPEDILPYSEVLLGALRHRASGPSALARRQEIGQRAQEIIDFTAEMLPGGKACINQQVWLNFFRTLALPRVGGIVHTEAPTEALTYLSTKMSAADAKLGSQDVALIADACLQSRSWTGLSKLSDIINDGTLIAADTPSLQFSNVPVTFDVGAPDLKAVLTNYIRLTQMRMQLRSGQYKDLVEKLFGDSGMQGNTYAVTQIVEDLARGPVTSKSSGAMVKILDELSISNLSIDDLPARVWLNAARVIGRQQNFAHVADRLLQNQIINNRDAGEHLVSCTEKRQAFQQLMESQLLRHGSETGAWALLKVQDMEHGVRPSAAQYALFEVFYEREALGALKGTGWEEARRRLGASFDDTETTLPIPSPEAIKSCAAVLCGPHVPIRATKSLVEFIVDSLPSDETITSVATNYDETMSKSYANALGHLVQHVATHSENDIEFNDWYLPLEPKLDVLETKESHNPAHTFVKTREGAVASVHAEDMIHRRKVTPAMLQRAIKELVQQQKWTLLRDVIVAQIKNVDHRVMSNVLHYTKRDAVPGDIHADIFSAMVREGIRFRDMRGTGLSSLFRFVELQGLGIMDEMQWNDIVHCKVAYQSLALALCNGHVDSAADFLVYQIENARDPKVFPQNLLRITDRILQDRHPEGQKAIHDAYEARGLHFQDLFKHEPDADVAIKNDAQALKRWLPKRTKHGDWELVR
eukprot:Clim_evm13s191 gene=Clim_evmTU13s191